MTTVFDSLIALMFSTSHLYEMLQCLHMNIVIWLERMNVNELYVNSKFIEENFIEKMYDITKK